MMQCTSDGRWRNIVGVPSSSRRHMTEQVDRHRERFPLFGPKLQSIQEKAQEILYVVMETIPFRGQTERLLKRGIISGGSFKQSSSHCHLHQAACLPPEWNGLLFSVEMRGIMNNQPRQPSDLPPQQPGQPPNQGWGSPQYPPRGQQSPYPQQPYYQSQTPYPPPYQQQPYNGPPPVKPKQPWTRKHTFGCLIIVGVLLLCSCVGLAVASGSHPQTA